LFLVELAAFCTGIRWTCSQLIMQGEESSPSPLRHPLDMVIHLQPWMLLAILPIMLVVEGPDLSYRSLLYFQNEFQPVLILILILFGGILAFVMEFAEYLLLVNTSGITLSILGIVKEGITLLLAHYLHGDRFSRINILGLFICIFGMVIHGVSRHNRKQTTMRMDSLYSKVILKKQDQNSLLITEQTI